jgi:hypothetical protein
MPGERFGGLVGSGPGGWDIEPGWRPDPRRGPAGPWVPEVGRAGGTSRSGSRSRSRSRATEVRPAEESRAETPGAVFRSGGIADRGPLERGSALPEPRARESREYERQAEWRASASRALTELAVGEDEPEGFIEGDAGWLQPSGSAQDDAGDGIEDEEAVLIRLSERPESMLPLEPLRVLPYGISRKRLEQAIKDLQLPVIVGQEPDEADLVITLRNAYKQKPPILREAEMRGLPIYVLKSNTVAQMQAILTNLYALETDPRQLAMRELEEAIGLVRSESKPVELSPQNAFVRKLQHRAAEAANLVSRSRGREPFRRVRVYPEKARAWH